MKLEQLYNYTKNTSENPNFKKWFKNSKIVDSSGNPLVVYHGTNKDFTSFDYKLAGSGNDTGMRGRGLYFSPNKRTAQNYGSNILEVYLSIQNPFIPTDYKTVEEVIKVLALKQEVDNWGIDSIIPGIFKFDPEDGTLTVKSNSSMAGRFTEIVRDAGFDGIIYTPRQEIIIYDPTQVKAVDNNGDFSNSDTNIFA